MMQPFPFVSLVSRVSPVSRRRHMHQWPTLVSIVFALLLVLSACGGGGAPTSSTTPTTPCQGTSLTLLSMVSYGADAAAAFQQQTGIPVHVIPYAEHYDTTSHFLPSDVIWPDTEIIAQNIDNQGLFLKWESPNIGAYTPLGARLVPADHAYYPTGLTTAAAIVYNLNHVPAAGLPTTWTDLEKPAYKNLVAETSLYYTSADYTAVTGIAQLLGGPDQGKQFLLGLKANGTVFPATDDATLQLVETGTRAFGIVQDSAYYLAKHQGQPLGILYPTAGVIALTTDLGVSAHSTNQACAKQFVNWVLSSAGQTVLTRHDPSDSETYFIPLIQGVTPVVSRQVDGIPFVAYNVVKWTPLALSFRLWVDANAQSEKSALSSLLHGGGTGCGANCILPPPP